VVVVVVVVVVDGLNELYGNVKAGGDATEMCAKEIWRCLLCIVIVMIMKSRRAEGDGHLYRCASRLTQTKGMRWASWSSPS
jgi:hypothetical protein